jgi:hypothetical protein
MPRLRTDTVRERENANKRTPQYREKERERRRARVANDPEYRERERLRKRLRWDTLKQQRNQERAARLQQLWETYWKNYQQQEREQLRDRARLRMLRKSIKQQPRICVVCRKRFFPLSRQGTRRCVCLDVECQRQYKRRDRKLDRRKLKANPIFRAKRHASERRRRKNRWWTDPQYRQRERAKHQRRKHDLLIKKRAIYISLIEHGFMLESDWPSDWTRSEKENAAFKMAHMIAKSDELGGELIQAILGD